MLDTLNDNILDIINKIIPESIIYLPLLRMVNKYLDRIITDEIINYKNLENTLNLDYKKFIINNDIIIIKLINKKYFSFIAIKGNIYSSYKLLELDHSYYSYLNKIVMKENVSSNLVYHKTNSQVELVDMYTKTNNLIFKYALLLTTDKEKIIDIIYTPYIDYWLDILPEYL